MLRSATSFASAGAAAATSAMISICDAAASPATLKSMALHSLMTCGLVLVVDKALYACSALGIWNAVVNGR